MLTCWLIRSDETAPEAHPGATSLIHPAPHVRGARGEQHARHPFEKDNMLTATTIPATNNSAVSAFGVTRHYGDGETVVRALDGVDIDIQQGRLTAIMGASGSGKSTLMHLLAGLDRPTSGSVLVAGRELTEMNDDELTRLRREHIGFVFQFFNLLPMLTARENVLLPMAIGGTKPDPAWLAELIATVGLGDRLGHRPSQLSGGQQQRVAVARALASRPTVLFADEPTGNLDSHTSGEILDLLRRSVDDLGQTTVMVTHDPDAAATADRVVYLADGRIVADEVTR
jgi:putative ABC transport system ATP-binding protein